MHRSGRIIIPDDKIVFSREPEVDIERSPASAEKPLSVGIGRKRVCRSRDTVFHSFCQGAECADIEVGVVPEVGNRRRLICAEGKNACRVGGDVRTHGITVHAFDTEVAGIPDCPRSREIFFVFHDNAAGFNRSRSDGNPSVDDKETASGFGKC